MASPISTGNKALREGKSAEAIRRFAEALIATPELAKSFSYNLESARNHHLAARQAAGGKPKVAVYGWDLSHNAAGRVITLAEIYKSFADVEILGSLFASRGRAIWEPVRTLPIPKHTILVEEKWKFPSQALRLVAEHPCDLVHISKPRAPGILIGLFYKILWGATVLMDIDDEELAFQGQTSPLTLEEFLREHGALPKWENLTGPDWTRIAMGLADAFDGLTVSNIALQNRYGGEILRHAREGAFFKTTPELRRKNREKYGIAPHEKVVLFFGTPREHKGLLETAHGIASLNRQDVLFVIAGDFPDASLKSRIEQVPGCRTLFLGNRPYATLPQLLSIADCCTCLQDPASPVSRFQIPAKLSDSLAMGIPTLCSPVESLEDLEKTGEGPLFVENAPEAVGAALRRIFDEPAFAESLSRKAHACFENHFSSKVNAERLQNLLAELPEHRDGISDKFKASENALSQITTMPNRAWSILGACFKQIAKHSIKNIKIEIFLKSGNNLITTKKNAFKKPDNIKENKKNPSYSVQNFRDEPYVSNLPWTEAGVCPTEMAVSNANNLAIVIPVFNAPRELDDCLKSLLKYTDCSTRIMIINDASTECGVIDVLAEYKHIANVEIYHNASNLGFSATVNRGILLAEDCDLIILNSDTIVTKGFCRRLWHLAYSGERIGTVTPLSNNAGPFSIKSDKLSILDNASLVAHASALARFSKKHQIDIPTAHGFCMFIRRACINDVGMFDSEAFPKGYGEENDFCMRAASKGWRHLLDDSTFIFHKNAASFKNAKEELIKTNRATLDKRYPHYTKMVRDFICSEELKKCISDAEFAFNRIDENIDSEGAKILYILPRLNAKGGTPQTNADLMHGLRCLYNTQTFLLISDGLMINLFKVDDNGNIPLESHVISELILPSIHESHEYDMVLLDWCLKYSFDLIHYRHLAYHSFSVLPQLDKLGIKLIHSFHDFYAICPTVKLLDCDQKYCAGFCGNSHAKSDCKVDVWKKNDIKLLKNNFIYTWNAKITKYLQFFDAYITTSIFAKQLICNALPVVNKKPFYVIPHGREFQSFRKPVELTSAPDVLQVLVPGSITLAKGGKLLCKLARRLEGNVQFHMLGKASKDLNMPECVVCYGEYERDQFVNIVSKLSPQMHIGAIFSIWPETYSHTLSELWASGLPVLGFDYGAISERIRETGAGWVCDKNDIDSVIKTLKTIKNNNIMVNFANSQVLRWQHGDGKIRNLEWMAHQYCSVYSSLVAISKK